MMRTVILAALFALGLSAQTSPAQTSQGPTVPRKAREFSFVEPSGKTTLLSSLRGKVVVIQFLDTTCPHCQAYSGFLSQLTTELGPKGFKAWGVAFNEANAEKAAAYKKEFAPNIPIGYAMRNTVMSFLAIPEQLMAVPQIVVIDRKGQVRAQTSPRDEDEIRKADVMRKLLDTLLKESAGTTVSSVTKKTGK